MALTLQGMPGCCGIKVITNFPYDTTSNPKLSEEFKSIFDREKNYVLICSLVEKQLVSEDLLRKHGFRQVSSTLINPNSKNKLWVFLYDKKELKEIKKSVFKRKVASE